MKNRTYKIVLTLVALSGLVGTVVYGQGKLSTSTSDFGAENQQLHVPTVTVDGVGIFKNLTFGVAGAELEIVNAEVLMLTDDFYYLFNAGSEGKCLDVPHLEPKGFINNCGFVTGNWKITEPSSKTTEEPAYWLQTFDSRFLDFCLDASVTPSPAMTTCSSDSPGQLWRFIPAFDGFYYLQSAIGSDFTNSICLGLADDDFFLKMTLCGSPENYWSISQAITDNTWTGTWSSDCQFSLCDLLMLSQEGNKVTGTFGFDSSPRQIAGRIEGTLVGNTLSGTWSKNSLSSGVFSLTLSADRKQFSGRTTSGGIILSWCGNRSSSSLPDVCLGP